MSAEQLIKTSGQIDSEWLGGVLGSPGLEVGSVEPIGTGQMSGSFRVGFSGGPDDLDSVVVKLASEDEDSRRVGVGLGAYLREISFYRELADRIGGPLARCHLATYDPEEGWFTLVLDEVRGGTQGDQIAGCGPEEAEVALKALARLHAPVWNDLGLAATDWLNQPSPLNQALISNLIEPFFERFGDRIAKRHEVVTRRFAQSIDAWTDDRRAPLGLVHGDYRLDNFLFADGECTVVDWQTLSFGPAMTDCSYFLGGSLLPEDRKLHEERLVRLYYDELLAHGVTNFSWEECWEGYRRLAFLGILMAVGASMLVQRTERGDEMFMASYSRACQMAIDLDSVDLLPEPEAGGPVPLRPEPADEGLHDPGPEPLWNESWYFDAISDDASIGFYHRIGRLPNMDACLLSSVIVIPGGDSILMLDPGAPLPSGDGSELTVETADARATQVCEEQLGRFRVHGSGKAMAYADHSAPFRGEDGEPVEISFDLTWETNGIPYQWRLSTRYEIPCRVRGTITVGDTTHEFDGPGQRDHSWGSRDWWASEWMWSGLHLDDGTSTHAVAVPQMPAFGVGYVQSGGEIAEVTQVGSEYAAGENGLIEEAKISMNPQGIEIELEPLGFGVLRMQAPEPDDRVTEFPRAMCRLHAADGREGLGWVEWNRPLHLR